jgi:Fe-S-cluster-containing hydrogenase component 2
MDRAGCGLEGITEYEKGYSNMAEEGCLRTCVTVCPFGNGSAGHRVAQRGFRCDGCGRWAMDAQQTEMTDKNISVNHDSRRDLVLVEGNG